MSVAWITLNRKCNMNCSYCYLKFFTQKNKELKLCDALKLINNLKTKGYEKIFLIGGEPSLYKNLFEIITYISLNKIKPFLLTNGINLVKADFVRKLKNAGLFSINISFKTDFWVSNKSKYKKIIIKSFTLLKKFNMNYLVSFVITKNNFSYILNCIPFLKELGTKYFYFAFENDISKNNENLKNVFSFLSDFVKNYSKINDLCPDFLIHSVYPVCFYPVEFRKTILNEKKFVFLCQAHDNKAVIFDTNQDILFCNQNYKVRIMKYTNIDMLSKFKKHIPDLPFSVCNKCKYKKLCGGGCPLKWEMYRSNGISFNKL